MEATQSHHRQLGRQRAEIQTSHVCLTILNLDGARQNFKINSTVLRLRSDTSTVAPTGSFRIHWSQWRCDPQRRWYKVLRWHPTATTHGAVRSHNKDDDKGSLRSIFSYSRRIRESKQTLQKLLERNAGHFGLVGQCLRCYTMRPKIITDLTRCRFIVLELI